MSFEVPEHVYQGWDAREAGKRAERRWNRLFKEYEKAFPNEAAEFRRRMDGKLPADFEAKAAALIQECAAKGETIATRKASQNAMRSQGARGGPNQTIEACASGVSCSGTPSQLAEPSRRT